MKAVTRTVKTVYTISCPTEGCDGYNKDYTATIEAFLNSKELTRSFNTSWNGCHKCELTLALNLSRQTTDPHDHFHAELVGTPMNKEHVCEEGMVLLRSATTDGANPIYFLKFDDHLRKYTTDQELFDSKQYYYDEHTCPTNWIRGIDVICYDGDTDPHGVFELVAVYRPERFKQIVGCSIEEYRDQRHTSASEFNSDYVFQKLLQDYLSSNNKETHEQAPDAAE